MDVHIQGLIFLIILVLFKRDTFAILTSTNNNISNLLFKDLEGKFSILNRKFFPPNFVFGTSSSAYQYEGAANEDERGPSIWDTYTHKFPENIADGENADVADDSYHRYKEDVKIMKEMGLDAYRFSISWSRVLPYGKISKGANKKGLMYYHNLVDELLANGIRPFVTLFHWDLPQYLQDEYGGFLSPLIVDDFRDYAELCFREFGYKVKHWMTLNEPWTYSTVIYEVGVYSSDQCPDLQSESCTFDFAIEPYLVTHYQLLAHAAAVQVYRLKFQAFQKGVIGIVLNSYWFVPFSETRDDEDAALRALNFMFGWFMDPITYGTYPLTMRALVGDRLPRFSRYQSLILKGSYDFLGLNYYTSFYAAYDPTLVTAMPTYATDVIANFTPERYGIPIGPKGGSDWLYVYPRGIYDLLLYIKRNYRVPYIYIAENGYDELNNDSLSTEEALEDFARIDFHQSHLAFILQAIRDGVKLTGYFVWSLLDNFEWDSGYTVRFGLNYVDFKYGLKRYPKRSAEWFRNFLRK